MELQRWKKIEDIFQDALDLEGKEREEFVREKCGDDVELRLEVEKLIARFEKEESFLESPVWTDSILMQPSLKQQIAGSLEEEMPVPRQAENAVGRQIGVFRLTEEIGKGGMGVVYAAERADGEFRQKVAIKLIKRGMDTDFIVKRFRHERQIAATLNHPNIARLLDGGTTSDDLPYFVLEFIDGKPLFSYAETNHLDLRQRLKLFLQICAAVAYAHGKQIVHRDIKPGNILVTNDGEPKLLDFGIAKILDPDLIHESVMPTQTQMRLMTPEYASPEQVRGDEITPASDQYSLGVLLYELITGQRPYKFPSRAPHEIARVICEEIPSEPSSGEFGKMLSGDLFLDKDFCQKLDRIVLKSLRKNPAERYASVKAFAEDIERFLRSEPIRAELFADTNGKKAVETSPKIANQKSIAVLPFNFMTTISGEQKNTGANDEFLSIGLADALITRLSKVKQFVVRPTSSILPYGDRNIDSFAAGEKLNVQFVIDGSIIKTEKQIRVSVQLLNVAEQSTVWAERFDEDLIDVLQFEDKISAKVTELLVPQLTTGDFQDLGKRGTNNAAAYEAYLRGRYSWNLFSDEGFNQAIGFYNKAVELDPNYALAHAGIADYYVWRGIYGVVPPAECYPPAKQAALRAIEIDDKLPEAYAALGLAKLYGDYDWQQSETDMRHAIELNPNIAFVHLWYAYNLFTQGRFDEATNHVKQAVELDPLSFLNRNTLAWSFYCKRQIPQALMQIEDVIERFPLIFQGYTSKSSFLNFVGRTGEALKAIERALELSGGNMFTLYSYAHVLAAAGERDKVNEVLKQIEDKSEDKYLSYFQTVIIYCYLKDKDKAFESLELSYRNRESILVWVGIEPSLDFLRDDARYFSLLKKLNHPTLKTLYKNATEDKTLVKEVGEKPLSKTAEQQSIAVLPFQKLNTPTGENSDGDFLNVGLADALITRFSNVRQFVVRPTSSVLRYNTAEIDSVAAGRELDVKYVLSGTLSRTDKHIRVSVQLLNVAEQSIVWAQRFDEDLTDVLELEDSISNRVVESLLPKLSAGEAQKLAKRATNNPEAYEAFLRGRFHWNNFTEEGFSRAITYFREAIELDPNYAQPHAAIADYYNWLGMTSLMTSEEFYPAAVESASRAIELDPNSSEAYAALGLAQLYGKYDWKTSEKNMLRAIELSPNNSVAHLWYTHNLYTRGDFVLGAKRIRRALELDPTSFQNHNTQAWSFYFERRLDDAVAKANELIETFPAAGYSYFGKSAFLRLQGKAEESLKNSFRSIELSDDALFKYYGHGAALAAAGRREEALEIIENPPTHYSSAQHTAIIYCYLKDKEKALETLEKGVENHESNLIWIAVDPALDLLRDDARYFALLERMNHPALQTIYKNRHEKIAAPKVSKEIFAVEKPDQKSIAVLPFKILNEISGDTTGGGEFLGVGLADALITRLSTVRQFTVRPTSSVLRFGKETSSSFTAGKELNVKFVLDGNILHADKQIRVSVQLLDVENESTVWAERFSETFTDVLELEDAISAKVAESIVPQLTTRERENLAKRGTDNAKAYEAYLRGRYHWNTFTETSFAQAFAAYQEAISLDPNFALAHAGIADYFIWLGIYGVLPPKQTYQPAIESAKRAVAIDDKLPEAHAALGFARLCGDYDWKKGESDIRRALFLNPNYAVAHNWLAILLFTAARFDEGIEHARRSIELDPLTYQNYRTLSWGFYFSRRFEEALKEIDHTIEKFPMFGVAYANRSWALRAVGKTSEALESAQKAVEIAGGATFVVFGLAQSFATAGKRDEAIETLEKIETNEKVKYVSRYQVALVYCYLKEKENALDALEAALKDGEGWLLWLAVEPALDVLRDEPRFVKILEQVSQSEATTKSISAANFLPTESASKIELSAEKPIKSRRTGIKHGLFLIILAIILLPVLVASVVAFDFFEGAHAVFIFFLLFGGGLVRIIYAFFFEPKDIKVESEKSKPFLPKIIKYPLLAISLLSVGLIIYGIAAYTTFDFSNAPPNQRWRNTFASTMVAKRLTTSGKAKQVGLSPDGKRIAYVVDENGQQSLWIRSTEQENVRQIVAPESTYYTEVKFSPDGNYVYYISSRSSVSMLSRVAVTGGTPEKISENVLNMFAFSPDGRRIVYDHRNSDNRQNSLYVAEFGADNQISSAQTLFVLDLPNYFPGTFSFSPDGSKLAYPRSVIEENKEVISLFIYDFETRTNEKFGAMNFNRIDGTAWRKNGTEIVLSAKDTDSAPHQLWLVTYPSGEISRLSNDFTDYYGVSLTEDGSTLATTKINVNSAVWTDEISDSNRNPELKFRQLTNGFDRQDGFKGINWTRDNRILYTTGVGEERGIAVMNADGSNSQPISTGASDPKFPSLTADNRFLIFADSKAQELNIWQMDLDTNQLSRISTRFAVTPTLAPNNQTIVYSTLLSATSNKLTIHRKTFGGEEITLTSATSVRPIVSPDNKFVACNYAGAETDNKWQIAVLPFNSGDAPTRFLKPYTKNFFVSPQERPLAWSPDGRFLYYLDNANNINNIFRIAVSGDATPVQITKFTSGEIFDFALSNDGKNLAITRGATSSDVVIFKNN